ncbi:hypothetical protein ACFL0T_09015 [Candidatus Omnitrophota bacterium]
MRDIASWTGAQYFRATDKDALKKVYEEIDRLEKIPMKERGYDYKELFRGFLIFGLFLLILEVALSNSFLKKVP